VPRTRDGRGYATYGRAGGRAGDWHPELDAQCLRRPRSWIRPETMTIGRRLGEHRLMQIIEDWDPVAPQLHLLAGIDAAQVRFEDAVDPHVADRFGELVTEWKRETIVDSSVKRRATHRAYQQIIGLGRPALPLILAELDREPDYWFWALTAITGEDPARDEETLEGARARWLEWAREDGPYL